MPDDEEELDQDSLDPNIRKALRKLEKDNHDLALKAAIAERDAAFVRAGIPDTPIGQLFAKSYEGESDPAAVKAAYDALGLTEAPASEDLPPEPSGPTDQELDAQRRIASAGAAGDNDGSIRYEDAIGSAKDVGEVMALLEAAPPSAVDFAGRRVVSPIID